jgi:hypothetical protein
VQYDEANYTVPGTKPSKLGPGAVDTVQRLMQLHALKQASEVLARQPPSQVLDTLDQLPRQLPALAPSSTQITLAPSPSADSKSVNLKPPTPSSSKRCRRLASPSPGHFAALAGFPQQDCHVSLQAQASPTAKLTLVAESPQAAAVQVPAWWTARLDVALLEAVRQHGLVEARTLYEGAGLHALLPAHALAQCAQGGTATGGAALLAQHSTVLHTMTAH